MTPTDAADSKLTMGFHPDPAGSGRLRWWNGRQWTETYKDVVSETTGRIDQLSGILDA